PVLTDLPLGDLQGLRDALEGDVEALLETRRLEEAQLLGALVAPLRACAPKEVAGRVALAHAAIFEDVDLFTGGPTEIAGDEAADRPAHRCIRAAEVQQVLLRLVRSHKHRALLRKRVVTARL